MMRKKINVFVFFGMFHGMKDASGKVKVKRNAVQRRKTCENIP